MSVTDNCRLCGNQATLKKSHIISKFIWRLSGVIGAQKKFDAICLNDPSLSQRNKQDGFKEPLLCGDCEELRSRFEVRAMSALFANIRNLTFVHNNSILTGLDYEALKLHSMFQIWMMGVSTNPFFAHVELGPHEKKLADLLLAEDPAEPWRYGSTVAVIGGNDPDWAGLFSQPERIRLYGHNVYRFVAAGIYSFHYVSSHAPDCDLQHLFLQTNGTWPIFQGRISDYPDLVKKAQQLRSLNK